MKTRPLPNTYGVGLKPIFAIPFWPGARSGGAQGPISFLTLLCIVEVLLVRRLPLGLISKMFASTSTAILTSTSTNDRPDFDDRAHKRLRATAGPLKNGTMYAHDPRLRTWPILRPSGDCPGRLAKAIIEIGMVILRHRH